MTISTRPQWCIEPLRPHAFAATKFALLLQPIADREQQPDLRSLTSPTRLVVRETSSVARR